ncbi:inactive beta-amylase 9-like [Typha latifolia]|uniref:inactive beta-amylase 9-like n=1 Tax=Typha latifolia TaxID=4733 RepID=UPI003C2E7B8B
MEVALTGPQAVAGAKPDAFRRSVGFREATPIGSRSGLFGFDPTSRRRTTRAIQVTGGLKAIHCEMGVEKKETTITEGKSDKASRVKLFVGLPIDAVTDNKGINHSKAISAGLRALNLLGARGVELPIFWAVAQPDSKAQYDFASYLSLAAMARDAGLELRVSLLLDSSSDVPLPPLVSRAAAADPDILFSDRSGRRHPSCLSFAADQLPVLDGGQTPLEAFESFFACFREAFAEFLGDTIKEVSIGLGPDGELRYPSFSKPGGVGEFQCYDKYMLASLKRQAEESGNPFWGLSGPHDAPQYDQPPDSGNFFKDHGGSWETPYGNFFLSWYSQELVNHGDRVLSIASKVFGGLPVQLSAKVPLLHWWHNTRSRPAELTAGFYNADGRDGYDAVAEMFARNSCLMILPGMELADREQPQGLQSSPEDLLAQIMRACERHGVQISGENSSPAGVGAAGFSRIKEKLFPKDSRVNSFTYQRMGAEFFSPGHWPLFMGFIRSMAQPETAFDDLPSKGEGEKLSLPMSSVPGTVKEMQAA